MKAVVLDGYTENPGDLSWDGLARLAELTVYDRTKAEDTVKRIGDAEIIFTNKTPITEEVMAACPSLRFIGILATGFNVVDVESAGRRGIVVSNIPGYGTESVAQHTFALILELANHVGDHSAAVKRGEWQRAGDFCFQLGPITELAGKTIGIIGYGSIGRRTADIAEAFGMKILFYGRHCDESMNTGTRTYRKLEELLHDSDIISLHCPLNAESERMINRDTISLMRDGVWMINTARGGLVDEEALREGLQSGKIGAAAVDVAAEEPLREDSPLLKARNIFITPHIAWASHEARKRLMDTAEKNLEAFISGTPINVVSRPNQISAAAGHIFDHRRP